MLRPERYDGGDENRQRDEHVGPEAEADSEDEAGKGAYEDRDPRGQSSCRKQAGEEERGQKERRLRVVAKLAEHRELQRREDQDERPERGEEPADEETKDAEERGARDRVERGEERDERVPRDFVEPPDERGTFEQISVRAREDVRGPLQSRVDGGAVEGGGLQEEEVDDGPGLSEVVDVAVAAGAHHRGPELGLVVAPLLGARDDHTADDAGDDRERDGDEQVGSLPGKGQRSSDTR